VNFDRKPLRHSAGKQLVTVTLTTHQTRKYLGNSEIIADFLIPLKASLSHTIKSRIKSKFNGTLVFFALQFNPV
jgi:hypothetical protein